MVSVASVPPMRVSLEATKLAVTVCAPTRVKLVLSVPVAPVQPLKAKPGAAMASSVIGMLGNILKVDGATGTPWTRTLPEPVVARVRLTAEETPS